MTFIIEGALVYAKANLTHCMCTAGISLEWWTKEHWKSMKERPRKRTEKHGKH